MKRIGILNVDALTEKLVRGLFRAVPDSQVFLFCGDNERARKLSIDLPCWTPDSYQNIVDEVDVIIIGGESDSLREIAPQVQLHGSQTLISLVHATSIQRLRDLFGHTDCVRLMLTFAAEMNKSSVILTAADNPVQQLFAQVGELTVFTDESEFELATVSMGMNCGFYYLAEGLQRWFVQKGLTENVARRLVLNGLKDVVQYAEYKESARLDELGKEMALSGHFTQEGLEILTQMQALKPWVTASERALSALQEKTKNNDLSLLTRQ